MTFTYSRRIIQNLSGVEVSYGGILFPPALNLQVSVRPLLDTARRTNKYSEFSIRIEGIWSAADSAASQGVDYPSDVVTAVFKTLTRSGLTLTLNGVGLGTFSSTYLSNITYGPHPTMVSWKPLSSIACYFVWECVATGINCTSGAGSVGEFTWGVTFGINNEGMTTRTIAGMIEVFARRSSEGAYGVVGNVDSYRDTISFPPLPNFRRDTAWDEAEDKRFMKFRIVDTEIPSDNPFFPGMVDMKVTETLSGAFAKGGLIHWEFELTGTIMIAAGLPRILAWLAFLAIAQSRKDALNAYGPSTPVVGGEPAPVTLINPRFQFSNEVFGRTLSFAIGYTLICGLDLVLQASGLWRPVPGTNWQQWSASMAVLQGNRGVSGLATTAADDIIVDFCSPLIGPSPTASNIPGLQHQTQSVIEPGCPVLWLQFQNRIVYSRDTNVSLAIPYTPGGSNSSSIQTDGLLDGNEGGDIIQPGTSDKAYVQDRGAGMNYIILEGYGVRMSAKINAPKIVSIGGVIPTEGQSEITFSTLIGHTSNGCPVYISKWKRVYYMPTGASGKTILLDGIPKPNQ